MEFTIDQLNLIAKLISEEDRRFKDRTSNLTFNEFVIMQEIKAEFVKTYAELIKEIEVIKNEKKPR